MRPLFFIGIAGLALRLEEENDDDLKGRCCAKGFSWWEMLMEDEVAYGLRNCSWFWVIKSKCCIV